MAVNNPVRYKDLDLNFTKHPVTKDVSFVINENSVNQAFKLLILISIGEIPFKPNKGSDVYRSLFENASPTTAVLLKQRIEQVIKNFEPRVELKNISVNFNFSDSSYEIRIEYFILNIQTPFVFNYILERIR